MTVTIGVHPKTAKWFDHIITQTAITELWNVFDIIILKYYYYRLKFKTLTVVICYYTIINSCTRSPH